MAKAFKKPNLKLLKAIKYLQNEKKLLLKSFSHTNNWFCFKITGESFVLDRLLQEKTYKIFHKDFIHFTENEITFYLR